MRPLLTLALLIFSIATTTAEPLATETNPRFINDGTSKGPFSQMVEVDGLIFLSGALGIDPATGKLVDGGIEAEARQTMNNIKNSLASENIGMDRIVKCTVMLADIKDWPALNSVYSSFFTDQYPARSAFAASALALDALVEIECIAKR